LGQEGPGSITFYRGSKRRKRKKNSDIGLIIPSLGENGRGMGGGVRGRLGGTRSARDWLISLEKGIKEEGNVWRGPGHVGLPKRGGEYVREGIFPLGNLHASTGCSVKGGG